MPKYRVTIPVYAEWQSIIEADTAEDAIEAAETGSICAHCQGWGKRDESEPSLFVNDDALWEDADAEEWTA